ncbi:hypothetical protein L1987_21214 [Smallanthus sonchifolius]|uniref:Uncharacterized protein n=1 Tax=Smallanthus sonchifolius TaxID=185202 RepID=A0ACB9IVW4_9ASTR|nr:hypothetical protein L1987_21214 [Smallanthus sonchifolius]
MGVSRLIVTAYESDLGTHRVMAIKDGVAFGCHGERTVPLWWSQVRVFEGAEAMSPSPIPLRGISHMFLLKLREMVSDGTSWFTKGSFGQHKGFPSGQGLCVLE